MSEENKPLEEEVPAVEEPIYGAFNKDLSTLTVTPEKVKADGKDEFTIEIKLKDDEGNPVTDISDISIVYGENVLPDAPVETDPGVYLYIGTTESPGETAISFSTKAGSYGKNVSLVAEEVIDVIALEKEKGIFDTSSVTFETNPSNSVEINNEIIITVKAMHESDNSIVLDTDMQAYLIGRNEITLTGYKVGSGEDTRYQFEYIPTEIQESEFFFNIGDKMADRGIVLAGTFPTSIVEKDIAEGDFDRDASTITISKDNIVYGESVEVNASLFSVSLPDIPLTEKTAGFEFGVSVNNDVSWVSATRWDEGKKAFVLEYTPTSLGQVDFTFRTASGSHSDITRLTVRESKDQILQREAGEGIFDIEKSKMTVTPDELVEGKGTFSVSITLKSVSLNNETQPYEIKDFNISLNGSPITRTFKEGVYSASVPATTPGDITIVSGTDSMRLASKTVTVTADRDRVIAEEVKDGLFSQETSVLTISDEKPEANGVDGVTISFEAKHQSEPSLPLTGHTGFVAIVNGVEKPLRESDVLGTYVTTLRSVTEERVEVIVKSKSLTYQESGHFEWVAPDETFFDDSSTITAITEKVFAHPDVFALLEVELIDVGNLKPMGGMMEDLYVFNKETEERFKAVDSNDEEGIYSFAINGVEPGTATFGFGTTAKTSGKTTSVQFTEVPKGLFDVDKSTIKVSTTSPYVSKEVTVTALLIDAITGKPMTGVENLILVESNTKEDLGVFKEEGDGVYTAKLTNEEPLDMSLCYETDAAILNTTVTVTFKELPKANPTDNFCDCMARVMELREELEENYSPELERDIMVEEKLCRLEAFNRGELEFPTQDLGECNND